MSILLQSSPVQTGLLDASLPWVALALLVAVIAGVFALGLILARLKPMERRLERLDRLDEIKAALDRLIATYGDLDLRRVEHALLDIRDGQRRVEDRLLSVIEASRGGSTGGGALEPSAATNANSLADRVVTRLLALGYERVQLVTTPEELALLIDGDGEVLIEARRDGSPCKGRVSVRRGLLTDVQVQAAYSTFP